MNKKSFTKIVENPFVKPENQHWHVNVPRSLERSVSPPLKRRQSSKFLNTTTAAVEAGEAEVDNHVAFFSEKLTAVSKPVSGDEPRLGIKEWIRLYERNLNEHGHHFVIHQHDHPIAGTHYDLRLQCNKTSSISFAIMYGLPGDPNSKRLNRNATETRVHNLWNHLIETASNSTGSMLLWDCGEYSVLPSFRNHITSDTDEESIEAVGSTKSIQQVVEEADDISEPQKLHRAFQNRKIRLRLNGTRLPSGYTIYLRLTKDNDRTTQPGRPSFRRKRKSTNNRRPSQNLETSESEQESEHKDVPKRRKTVSSLLREATPPKYANVEEEIPASDDEDEKIRLNNAYTGATNSIGSIHQRKWYLSLDRNLCGFTRTDSRSRSGTRKHLWIRKQSPDASLGGFDKFHVLGRESERSVVTGRLAKDILKDEGVAEFVPRGLWRPVTE